MRTNTDFQTGREAVERWLKKRPPEHLAKRIHSPESLSEPERTLLAQTLSVEEQILWMIDLPSQGILRQERSFRRFWRMGPMWELTPSRVVALTDQRLLLICTIRDGKNPPVTAIPVKDILYLEHGYILLFAWLKVHWVENGTAGEETLFFNPVCEDVFLPMIDMLRRAIASGQSGGLQKAGEEGGETQQTARRDRNLPERLPLKFVNLISRYGLLAEERICQLLYRPAQWRSLLGVTQMMNVPGMVMLRTDAYLLLATENWSLREGSYGLTFTFLPLQFVREIKAQQNGKRCSLSVRLEEKDIVREWPVAFPPDMYEAVIDFANQFVGMKNRR